MPGTLVGTYVEPHSGLRFTVSRPADQPILWWSFLRGAEKAYSRHGVENALMLDEISDGASTTLFFTAQNDGGRVVAGIRVEGPVESPDDARAMREWGGRAGTAQLRAEIADRIGAGVIELKAGWVDPSVPGRRMLTAALARGFVHSMDLLRVRYAFCTAAQHAIPPWLTTGGVVSPNVAPVAYPDDRYETSLIWWDRFTVADLITSDQLFALSLEAGELERTTAAPAATTLQSVA